MKINGFLFLILAIGLILGSVAIYAYVQAMSPVWADIAQKQAQQDIHRPAAMRCAPHVTV